MAFEFDRASLVKILLPLALALPIFYIYLRPASPIQVLTDDSEKKEDSEMSSSSIPAAAAVSLPAPKEDPFTLEQLKPFDGSNPDKPIYVSIKGTVFDVSAKRDTYGPGCSYNIFAGKDASRALGMSTLKSEEAVADYSTLNEQERKVLDDWHLFFGKKYPIVGKVVDLPKSVANL